MDLHKSKAKLEHNEFTNNPETNKIPESPPLIRDNNNEHNVQYSRRKHNKTNFYPNITNMKVIVQLNHVPRGRWNSTQWATNGQ